MENCTIFRKSGVTPLTARTSFHNPTRLSAISILLFACCVQTIIAAPIPILNQDNKRPDDQFQVDLFGRPLTIGGEYEFEPTYREDYSLGNEPDDTLKLKQHLQIELLYQASQDITLFAKAKFKHNADLYIEDGDEHSDSSFVRGETWIQFDNLADGGLGTRIGRQNFSDKREWWWDEDLDAIRVYYQVPNLLFEYSLAEELGRTSTKDDIDPEDDDIRRQLGRIKWNWARKQSLELFLFNHNDRSKTPGEDMILPDNSEDEFDADLSWIGLRAMGRIKNRKLGRFKYWVDTGYVRGEETIIDFDDLDDKTIIVDETDKYDVEGWGFDIGVTWISKLKGEPRFTLSYAQGSGDSDTNNDTDRNYRQTGIHDNNAKFGGVDSFKYYGEVLRPDLSNIKISTLAVGYSLLNSSSIEFLFHNYRQVHAAEEIRGSKLRIDPNGISRDIGNELDIVLGLEEWKHLEMELVLGLFKAGNAFGDNAGDTAKTAIFKLKYNY